MDHPLLLFESGGDPLDTLVEFLHAHRRLIVAGGEQSRLVDEIGEIRPTEAGGDSRHLLEVDRWVELHVGHVNPQDRLASADVGPIDEHVAIEAAGAEQGRIERFGTVRGGHHDHAGVAAEAVHLHEEGVEGLLAFVVAAHHARAAGLAEGVEFVDEDDAGGFRFGLLEHVAHAGRADADEHLHEVAAREAEERHAGLAGDRLGEQGLAGAGRPHEQHALRDVAAEHLVFFRAAQKFDDLAQLLHRLVDSGHVVERDAEILLGVHLAAAPAEGHRAASPAEPPHHHEEQHAEETGHEQHRQPVAPGARRLFIAEGHTVFGQELRQLSLGVLTRELRGVKPAANAGRATRGRRRLCRLRGDFAQRARHLEGADHDVGEVGVEDGRPGRPARHFHRLLLGPRVGSLARRADQSFEIAVGQLDLRIGVQETEREQSGNAYGDQRPDDVRSAEWRPPLGGSLRKGVLGRHEASILCRQKHRDNQPGGEPPHRTTWKFPAYKPTISLSVPVRGSPAPAWIHPHQCPPCLPAAA